MSTSSSASPLPAPSGAMSLRTPVEVSACTTAMIAGAGWAASEPRRGSIGSPHGGVDPDDVGAEAVRHLAHPLAEDAVDPDDDGVAGPHEVDERGLHAGRAGPAHGQGQRVRGGEDLAQAVVRVVEQGEELRVEVAEHGPGQRHGDLRVRIRRPGPHEQAVGYRHRRIVAGPCSPAPTRRSARRRPVDCLRGTGALRPPGAPAPPSRRRPGSGRLCAVGRRAREDASAAHARAARRHARPSRWSWPVDDARSEAIGRTLEALQRRRPAAGPSPRGGRRPAARRRHGPAGVDAPPVPPARPGRSLPPPGRPGRELLRAGLAAHRGDNVALVFPGDVWAPDAVALLSAALTPTGVVYADEDRLAPDGAPRLHRASSPATRPSSSSPRPTSDVPSPWAPASRARLPRLDASGHRRARARVRPRRMRGGGGGDPHRRGALPPVGTTRGRPP